MSKLIPPKQYEAPYVGATVRPHLVGFGLGADDITGRISLMGEA